MSLRVSAGKQQGFTIVEVMVGLVILAIALLGMAALQVTSVKGNYASADVTQAAALAEFQLEYLRNLPSGSADLTAGQHSASTGISVPSPFSMQYTVVDGGLSNKIITVTVSWIDRGTHSISLKSLRFVG